MAELSADQAAPRSRKRRKLLLSGAVVGTGLFSCAVGYLGLVAPTALLSVGSADDPSANPYGFVDVPRITLPLAGSSRQLFLRLKLEALHGHIAEIEQQMPRLLDRYNSFLSDIAPAAFDRRGVLEIIRAELQTRTDMVLGETSNGNVLITEFAIQ